MKRTQKTNENPQNSAKNLPNQTHLSSTELCSYTSAASDEDDPIFVGKTGVSIFDEMLHKQFKNHSAFIASQKVNDKEIDASHFTLFDAPILGVGGFGLVRLVCKISPQIGKSRLSDLYAVKSIAKHSILTRTSGVSAIFNELHCLTTLANAKSPFICNIHHAFQDRRYLFMSLEYCSGGDLRHNLRSQPAQRYTEQIARFLISQCFLAVQTCHDHFLLHRDIKPENLVLDSNGYIKLTDFGVSKFFASASEMKCKSTSGTHGYMSPEIYLKGHVHGKESDYFALGVTLHELVIGQRPFESKTIKQAAILHSRSLVISDNEIVRAREFGGAKNMADMLPDRSQSYGLSLDLLNEVPFLSPSCKLFISSLLSFHPTQRLAFHSASSEDSTESISLASVKKHPWFRDFDWKLLERRLFLSPLRPSCGRLPKNAHDNREINQDFVCKHYDTPPISLEDDRAFEGFQYNISLSEPSKTGTTSEVL